MDEKIIIYQVLPRLFGNVESNNKKNGTIEENGCGKFNYFTPKVLAEIKKLGTTHVWYTGILNHASKTRYPKLHIAESHAAVVKGIAGSPYAVRDYYDVTPDLAENPKDRMKEFEQLVARTHEAGMKVITDFVPNHVARQYHSTKAPKGVVGLGETDNTSLHFSPQNNFYYMPGQKFCGQFDLTAGEKEAYVEDPAKATGNNCFHAYPSTNDWYETAKLNYGVSPNGEKYFSPIPDTWIKMCDILLFWASKKIDAVRCDMAELVPVEFWHWAIAKVKEVYPNFQFIAEVYNPQEYRNFIHYGGFDYLYDKVGLYDTLKAVSCGHAPASEITHRWQELDDISDHMLNFLENHDEQRIASDFFAGCAQKGIPMGIISVCMNKSPYMHYFGQELGEKGMDEEGFSGKDGRTTIFDYWQVDTINRWYNNGKVNEQKLTSDEKQLRKFYSTLMNLANKEKAISQGLFYDLMWVNYENQAFDSTKQFAFLRKVGNEVLLIVSNFAEYDTDIQVSIPAVVTDFCEISNKKQVGTSKDLLSGGAESNFSNMIPIHLPANSGKIIKYKFK